MSSTIDYSKAQKQLVVLWCSVSVIVFIIYFVQTLTGKYLDHVSDVWEWVLQFVIPPLTLMIGVLINQLSSESKTKVIDSFYFRIAFGFSGFFLLLLLLSAVLVPFIHQAQNSNVLITEITEENQITIIDAFNDYNNFLIPVQGITTLTLGLFFTKTK
jgi:hypothetical protein